MRRDEPANVMHVIKPLLLMLTLLLLVFVAERASADTVRVHDTAGSAGPEVILSQIAELSGEYAQTLGGVVVGRFDSDGILTLELEQVRKALVEGGAAVGRLNLQGFSSCTIYRTIEQSEDDSADPVLETNDSETPAANTHDEPITIHTPTTVRQLIIGQIVETLGLSVGDLEIGFEQRDRDLLGQSCVAGRYTAEPVAEPRLGGVSFRVRAFRGTEQIRQSTISVTIKQRVLAVVATDNIGRGDTIHRGLVRIREVLIDSANDVYLKDPLLVIGQVASKPVEAGALVQPGSIEQPVAVHRREQVEVTLDQGGLRITFTGEAQDSGSVGQTIEVKNAQTRQTFTATVTGRRQVTVGEIQT